MKRIVAVLFVVALAFTMVSGCCGMHKDTTDTYATCMDKCQSIEQSCTASARAAEAAAMRAENAARRAEAAAEKCEAMFKRHLKK